MFVQNGVQKIEVYVKRDRGGGGQKGNRDMDTADITNTDGETSSDNKHMSQRTKRIILTNTTHAYAITKQVGNMAFNHYLQGISMKHGDEALQDNVRRTLEIAGDQMNFASSVAMGGIYGAWGGPVGAVIGTVLGGVSAGASIHFKYAGRERDFNYKIFKENNAVEYKRARANINLTTGRLR